MSYHKNHSCTGPPTTLKNDNLHNVWMSSYLRVENIVAECVDGARSSIQRCLHFFFFFLFFFLLVQPGALLFEKKKTNKTNTDAY